MGILITGVAGLVGTNLSAALLSRGATVLGIDDFSLGRKSNLVSQLRNPRFHLKIADLSSITAYRGAISQLLKKSAVSEIWHLAANSDIRAGAVDPDLDFRNTFLTTYNTLKVMREFDVQTIAFASSSAVYGDHGRRLLTEASGPLTPISSYGAMKLASEASICAASETFVKRAIICRFPNVVGIPATHGVVFDFVERLAKDPRKLRVLGNGLQRKQYLLVNELVEAMLLLRSKCKGGLSLYNIGPNDSGASVRDIAKEVVAVCAPGAEIQYGSERQGWSGDVPIFRYSTTKIQRLGWQPRYGSMDALRVAVRQVAADARSKRP